MSIFRKIMTAIKGGAREVGETIVDANAIRILEQEIIDAEQNMQKAKKDLTEVMAKQMQEGREVKRLKNEVTKHESYASQALDKGDEALALEVAQKISSLELELKEHEQAYKTFESHASRLKELVRKSEAIIRDHRRQLTMVKTTESVQKATASITDNFAETSSRVNSAQESLKRIKQRQQDFDDKLKAAEDLQSEITGEPLDIKLKEAGITANGEQSGQDILARIKAKKGQ